MTTWTTYRYIHLTYIQIYSGFLVEVIYVGLASARPNYMYIEKPDCIIEVWEWA